MERLYTPAAAAAAAAHRSPSGGAATGAGAAHRSARAAGAAAAAEYAELLECTFEPNARSRPPPVPQPRVRGVART